MNKSAHPTDANPAKGKEATRTIELSIALPSLPSLSSLPSYQHAFNYLRYDQLLRQRRVALLSIAGCLTVGAVTGGFLLARFLHSDVDANAVKGYTVHQLPKGNPDFDTIAPKGKNIDQMGGWTRVSPPESAAVYAYTDFIESIRINVSQQPLPESFKSDTAGEIEQLAASFLATEKVTVGSTQVFIGTSANGVQSVIFTKNQLLILIKSNGKVAPSKWADYINSLS